MLREGSSSGQCRRLIPHPPHRQQVLFIASIANSLASANHVVQKHSNNQAENSHQPVRRQKRRMQRFKSTGSAKRFLNLHTSTYNYFNLLRHLIDRPAF